MVAIRSYYRPSLLIISPNCGAPHLHHVIEVALPSLIIAPKNEQQVPFLSPFILQLENHASCFEKSGVKLYLHMKRTMVNWLLIALFLSGTLCLSQHEMNCTNELGRFCQSCLSMT